MRKIYKPVGVWLDNRYAFIVYLNDGDEKTMRLTSDIDESHPVGGSGSSTPYGAQDAISETKYLNRRQQQEKQYYQSIIQLLDERDGIYIMGPSTAKVGLEQELKKHPASYSKVMSIESCDRITDNQIRAKVRDFFSDR